MVRLRFFLLAILLVGILAGITEAAVKINQQGVGLDLSPTFSLQNVIRHKDYPDLAVPSSADNNAMTYRVTADPGNLITCVTVYTEIQSSVPHGPYLAAYVSKEANGPWTPLYVQRVNKAYDFVAHEETINCPRLPVYYVKLTFGDCWTDAQGHADVNIRTVRISTEEVASPRPEVTFENKFNVFTTGEKVRLTSTLVGQPRSYTLTDHLGHSVKTVNLGEAETAMDLGTLAPGFYHLLREKTEVARFCVVADGIQQRAIRSVAQVDLGYNGHRVTDKVERTAHIAQLAGVHLIRERFNYGQVLTVIGSDEFRNILKIERAHGLQVSFCFDNLGFGASIPEGKDLRDLLKNAKEVGLGMQDAIYCYEFRNETDSWPFGGSNENSANRYTSALKATFLGLRDADPTGKNYRIATCGISSIDRAEYIDQILANGIGPYFDIYNTHMYEPADECPRVSTQHQGLLDKYGLATRARWVTEASDWTIRMDLSKRPVQWNAEHEVPEEDFNTATIDPLDDETRERFTVSRLKSWIYAAESGWQYYFNYCLLYYNEGAQPFGILAPGITATSTYAALATYNNLVGDLNYAGRWSLGAPLEAHVYHDGAKTMAIAWSRGEAKTVPMANVAAVYAITGEQISGPAATVSLTSVPCYVQLASVPTGVVVPKRPAASASKKAEPAPNRVVLDFVRTPTGTEWRVTRKRTFILDKFGEKITGQLAVYNLGEKEWRGQLRGIVPQGWTVQLSNEKLSVPPMGRVDIPVTMTVGNIYQPGVQQLKIQTTDGQSVVVVPFIFEESMGVKLLAAIDYQGLQLLADEPSVIESTVDGGQCLLKASFRGAGRRVGFSAPLPENRQNGVYFELKSVTGAPSYIDVSVINRDGTESTLRPNFFPSLLPNKDGISVFAVKYDTLNPPTDAKQAASVKIMFGSFGPMDIAVSMTKLGAAQLL